MAITINKNLMYRNHTVRKRTAADIDWIVVHYVGAMGDAYANTEYYRTTDVGASADFWVGFDGSIWQGNDYYNYYSWHCGGGLQGPNGHKFYGVCHNSNSVGVEMCVRKKSTRTMLATDKDWYFEDATVKAAAQLVAHLMKELNVSIGHVIRHYDVTGKICPNPYVLNEAAWNDFKALCKKCYDSIEEPVVSAPAIDKIWMGWTRRESGGAGFRQTNGDSGRAYGKYQFDYRYGLVPFLQACVDHDPERYAGFKTFIGYGPGSPKLVNNSWLAEQWRFYCDHYPKEFEALQDRQAYHTYYLEAKKYIRNLYGIDMDHHGPAVKGSLFSMAIRSGPLAAAKKFAGCSDSTEDKEMLRISYHTYGTQDAYRWTADGQYGDAIVALREGTYTEVHTGNELPDDKPAAGQDSPSGSAQAPQDAGKGERYMFVPQTVRNGSTGNSARLLQVLLRGLGYRGADARELDRDGEAGKNTIYALTNFQKAEKLEADGICGPATWARLIRL